MLKNLPRFSVDNPVLANLLTVAVLVGGLHAALTIVRDVLPEIRPNRVQIFTEYPGATPEDVERGVTQKIEEVVKDIQGIDEITSLAREGASLILVDIRRDADLDRAVDDIKAAVDTIDDFPEEVKETRVTRWEPKWPVISVSIYGDVSDKQLKETAEELRDEIMDLADVNQIASYGLRDEQINIEVDPALLQGHHLSLLDVVAAVQQANLDMPGGQIRLPAENVAVRTMGERREAEAIRRIVVRATPSGQILTIGRIARVEDGFEDKDLYGRFNGKPNVTITVFRTADEDAIAIAEKIHALVDGKMGRPLRQNWKTRLLAALGMQSEAERIWRAAQLRPLPQGIAMATHEDLSRFIKQRLDLLRRNGIWGLSLVFLSLLIFLNRWVAFWVMTGVLLSILGTFIAMRELGLTLNMVSMFGLIVALGLLVDDAIVIGESVYRRIERGMVPKAAAVAGAQEVLYPVVAAVATTIAAFVPLTMIEGRMGDFIKVLPIVAGVALLISLVEALMILPSHLAEFLRPPRRESAPTGRRGIAGAFERARRFKLDQALAKPYAWLLRKALAYRYLTLLVATSALILAGGVIAGGRVEMVFFPKMDSDFVTISLRMPVGTSAAETERIIQQIEQAVAETPDVQQFFTLVGAWASDEEPVLAEVQSNVAQIMAELTPAERRARTSEQILSEIREKTKHLTGIDSLEFLAWGGAVAGPDISVEVSAEHLADILPAVRHIKDRLRTFDGVYDIRDDFEAGRREIQVELLPAARTLGLETKYVASQIRSAFHGLTARTIQRGRNAVDLVVRYPLEYRDKLSSLESLWISTPAGARVPLKEVAVLKEGIGYAGIKRHDRKRAVTVMASVDPAQATPDRIMDVLEAEYPKIVSMHPKVRLTSTGSRREAAKSFASLKYGFAVAAVLIYVCLAWLFRSYVQPLIVMVSIPVAFVGVVVGHLVMGYDLTIMSRIGYIALAGIAVNDALILVSYANQQIREGKEPREAAFAAGIRRLRPILLTSLTTILGLAPLMAERSFQARFLIPMAISVTFGLAFATLLTLVLVPALYLIVDDIKLAAGRLWYGPQYVHVTAATD